MALRPAPRYAKAVGRGRSVWALSGAWVATSVWVAISADAAGWSALILHAEPLLWLAAALGAYGAVQVRRYSLAVLLVFGTTGAAVLWRLPLPAPRPVAPAPAPPAWLGSVRRCAASLAAPEGGVSLLQWTVDPGMDAAAIVRTVVALSPDVTVLHRLTDASVLDRIQGALGGDILLEAAEAPWNSVGLHTRGEFPLCGPAGVWREGAAPGPGYLLAFVSPAEDRTFPLLVTRLPEPYLSPEWATSVDVTLQQLGVVFDALAAPAALLVADASATATYHVLNARLGESGMRVIPTPPNWPIHVEGLAFLPLHPYDRAWSGPAWSPRAWRVDVDAGTHAPLYFTLEPARRTGRYQAP